MHAPLARITAIVLSLALLAPGAPAWAQQPDAPSQADAQAAELKKRGDDLLERKRYADALEAYDAAYALAPSPALLYNRGRALGFLGRFPEALQALERFSAEAPPDLLERVPGLPRLLDDLRSRVGTLTIRSDVAGARVLVNDVQIGVTPLGAPVKLDAGHLRIDAFADGYFPFHREIDLAGNSSVAVDVSLVSRQTSGVLVVRSHVDATRIAIDQALAGLAPFEAGLLAGPHTVVASKPGYTPAETQVVLRAGETRSLVLDPIAPPSLLTRWWFWTAVGAVLVGGVVTYVALTTEKPAQGGDWTGGGIVRF